MDLDLQLREQCAALVERSGSEQPFGTYVVAVERPGRGARPLVERDVFGEFFGNTPELLAAGVRTVRSVERVLVRDRPPPPRPGRRVARDRSVTRRVQERRRHRARVGRSTRRRDRAHPARASTSAAVATSRRSPRPPTTAAADRRAREPRALPGDHHVRDGDGRAVARRGHGPRGDRPAVRAHRITVQPLSRHRAAELPRLAGEPAGVRRPRRVRRAPGRGRRRSDARASCSASTGLEAAVRTAGLGGRDAARRSRSYDFRLRPTRSPRAEQQQKAGAGAHGQPTPGHLAGFGRAGEDVALRRADAQLGEPLGLARSSRHLRRGRHAERVGHRDDRGDERLLRRVRVDRGRRRTTCRSSPRRPGTSAGTRATSSRCRSRRSRCGSRASRKRCERLARARVLVHEERLGELEAHERRVEPVARSPRRARLRRCPGSRSWRADRLTAMRSWCPPGSVAAPRRRAARTRSRAPTRRSRTMRPVSSAIEMNSSGGTVPRSGWFQRSNASKPHDVDRIDRHDRLVVQHELVVLERDVQVAFEAGAAAGCGRASRRRRSRLRRVPLPSPGTSRCRRRAAATPPSCTRRWPARATPMLADDVHLAVAHLERLVEPHAEVARRRRGRRRARRSCSSTTTNSSPPTRADHAAGAAIRRCRRCATATRSSSPSEWP